MTAALHDPMTDRLREKAAVQAAERAEDERVAADKAARDAAIVDAPPAPVRPRTGGYGQPSENMVNYIDVLIERKGAQGQADRIWAKAVTWKGARAEIKRLLALDDVAGRPEITEGFYLVDGAVFQVVRSGAGRLYAKRHVNGSWVYEAGAVHDIRPEHRMTDEQATAVAGTPDGRPHPKVEEGFYELDGDVYRVVRSARGNLYAKLLRNNRWVYASGALNRLRPEHRMTPEQVAAVGRRTRRCLVCGIELTDDQRKGPDGKTSLQRGVGPVCAKRIGYRLIAD